MKFVFFLNGVALLLLTLSGCTTVYDMKYTAANTPAGFEFIERRQDDPNYQYAGLVEDDKYFLPPPLEILKDRLASQVGPKLAGKTVVVRQLRIIILNTRPTPLMALIQGPRPMPPIMEKIPGLEKYTPWTLCDITVTVNGQKIEGHGWDPVTEVIFTDLSGHFRKALMLAVKDVIDQIDAMDQKSISVH